MRARACVCVCGGLPFGEGRSGCVNLDERNVELVLTSTGVVHT